jgi:hypothetical protein
MGDIARVEEGMAVGTSAQTVLNDLSGVQNLTPGDELRPSRYFHQKWWRLHDRQPEDRGP